MLEHRVVSVGWLLLEFGPIGKTKIKAFLGNMDSAGPYLNLAQKKNAIESFRFCETLAKIQGFSSPFKPFCLSLMGIPSALYRMDRHMFLDTESFSCS